MNLFEHADKIEKAALSVRAACYDGSNFTEYAPDYR